MCSYECPCEANAMAQWWFELSEETLNEYGRTRTQATIGTNSNPLKDANGNYRLVTTSSTGKYYFNFADCNADLQAKYVTGSGRRL